jgi:Ca-activated chloride channel homolog
MVIKIKYTLVLIFFIGNLQHALCQSANDYLQQGNALYTAKKYNDAIAQYQKITDNQTFKSLEKANGNYNIGNAYAKLQKWQEAVESYTKSLAQNPSNINAKYNLCYAKRKLEKDQEKKTKEDKKKEGNPKDKDEKKEKEKQQKQKDDSKKEQQSREKPQSKLQPSKLTKQQAEQYLKALKEEEKKILQQKMNTKQGGAKNGKDW